MSDVQESTAVRDGKTYGYQGQGQGEAAAAGTGLEQQKQRLMTDIEAFLDSLVVRVGASEGGTSTAGTTTTTTGPSTGKGGTASTGGAASTSGGTSSSSGQPASTSTSGAASTGKASTGSTSSTSSGSTTTGKAATGSGSASTGSASTGSTSTVRPGDKPGTEATPAQREALEKTIFGMREAYRIDREREAARLMRNQEAARTPSAPAGARTEAAALKHQTDSNRAPVTESREFGPAFGTKGRGVAMTMERMSVAMQERPETVAAPGTVSTRPIDAYWASFGTAVERAAVRAQADQQTKVLLETILGTDDRTRVNNVNEYPWRCICSLLITAQNGTQYLGTGWLVAPRLVLTAGHCVYMSDEGGWAAQIEVTPGRNADARDNGSAVSRDLRSVCGWTQDNDSNCDYGAIVLPEDKRFGDTLGWFGYAVRNDDYLKQITLNLSGYPGDGGPAHIDFTQWFMARGVKDVMDKQITYEIDTYGGQSGSPVWEMTADGSRYGVGIHTFGTNVANGATRIVQEVFDKIVEWAGDAS